MNPIKAFYSAIELVPPLDLSVTVPLDIQRKLLGAANLSIANQEPDTAQQGN